MTQSSRFHLIARAVVALHNCDFDRLKELTEYLETHRTEPEFDEDYDPWDHEMECTKLKTDPKYAYEQMHHVCELELLGDHEENRKNNPVWFFGSEAFKNQS